jgi:3',5'-cyclic AMP phosphodiesterase CpdA
MRQTDYGVEVAVRSQLTLVPLPLNGLGEEEHCRWWGLLGVDALAGLYDRYGVDLVLQGHDHTYARTHKVRSGQVLDAAEPGTVYTISVSGAKMDTVTYRRELLMARIAEGVQPFQVVSVSADRVEYTSRTADGAILDQFTIEKVGTRTRYVDGSGPSANRR